MDSFIAGLVVGVAGTLMLVAAGFYGYAWYLLSKGF